MILPSEMLWPRVVMRTVEQQLYHIMFLHQGFDRFSLKGGELRPGLGG